MNIDNIITKVFAGRATKEELDQLDSWKGESQDNLAALREMQQIHAASEEMEGYHNFDAEAAWSKVSSQIEDQPSMGKWWLWGLLVLFLAGAAYWYTNRSTKDTDPEVFFAQQEVLDVPLADGSMVNLDINGQLQVPLDWDSSRVVNLTGRAYFDVEKQPDGKQFVIDLPQGSVTVLGTAFAVDATSQHLEVGVKEGHVVCHLGNRKVDLFAGEKVELINGALAKTSDVDDQYFSWTTKELSFDDVLLAKAISQLSHHTKQYIVVAPSVDLSQCRISGHYYTVDVEAILKEWGLLVDLAYRMEKDTYIITAVGCK